MPTRRPRGAHAEPTPMRRTDAPMRTPTAVAAPVPAIVRLLTAPWVIMPGAEHAPTTVHYGYECQHAGEPTIVLHPAVTLVPTPVLTPMHTPGLRGGRPPDIVDLTYSNAGAFKGPTTRANAAATQVPVELASAPLPMEKESSSSVGPPARGPRTELSSARNQEVGSLPGLFAYSMGSLQSPWQELLDRMEDEQHSKKRRLEETAPETGSSSAQPPAPVAEQVNSSAQPPCPGANAAGNAAATPVPPLPTPVPTLNAQGLAFFGRELRSLSSKGSRVKCGARGVMCLCSGVFVQVRGYFCSQVSLPR